MTGTVPLLGVGLATGAALAFAIQYLFVRVGTTDGTVSDVMLVSLVCNVAIVVPAAVYLGPGRITSVSLLSFVAAGIVGSLLARVLEFKSVEDLGASRTSPVLSANVLFATVFAVVFLDESISPLHLAGIVLVVAGVAALSWEMAAVDDATRSFRDAGVALVVPLSAALFIALEPIVVAVGYAEGTSVASGIAIKVVAGLVGFAGYRWVTRADPMADVFRRPGLRYYLGAGLANTAGIGLYFAALEAAPVSIVMPILQTGPLLVLGLSAAFLPRRLERITPRLVAAAVVVVFGTVLVTLS